MKYTAKATIDAPIEQVDLARWLFELSDREYQACSRGHRGAGTFVEDGVRGTLNVESVGGTLMIQHYHEVGAEPARVEMLSQHTQAYVFHLIPTHFAVRWTLTAAPRSDATTTLQCDVEAIMPTALRVLAASVLVPYFLRKHVEEETPLFAADISRKLARRTA